MRKRLVILLLCTALCLPLYACSTDGSLDPSPSTSASIQPPTSSIAPTPTPTPMPPTPTPAPTQVPVREGLSFRSGIWKDDIETIKQHETALFLAEIDDGIVYSGEVASLDANAYYLIDSEYGLYEGMYVITEEHTSGSSYISDYNSLKSSLTEKYGEPISDEIIQTDRLAEYADDSQDIQLGYVAYKATWELDGTDILLGMSCDNYKITLLVSYSDSTYTPPTNTDGL